MQNYFDELASFLTSKLSGDEFLTMVLNAEDSDFIRFNKSAVRQAGNVTQRSMSIDLIRGSVHSGGGVTLTGESEEDRGRLLELLGDLRDKLAVLPEDPHLLYATEVHSTEQHGTDELPDSTDALASILRAGEGRDLVGIYAAGGIHCGFANSAGQRNWYSSYNFNFDWSYYLQADKAVKNGYAGFSWDEAAFTRKVDSAARQLESLARDPKTIAPGRYRVYLAPAAVADYIGLLGWGGYGLKERRTKQTVLLKMAEEDARLHTELTIGENTAEGIAPSFQGSGFLRPDSVTLIDGGKLVGNLINPRSAKEYGVPTNGANGWEMPESLDIAAGKIPGAEILERLDTGLYINNLWYLNFSDRPACRITGLTRFACFWVEGGEIVAPLNVMRFDETLYRAFGENLIGLTQEREVILDADTYDQRATSSVRVPGALIEGFNFNL
jgi:predicted Zn-dependent protease